MIEAAGGPSVDGLINAGTALLVAFVAGSVSLVTMFVQARAHKREQRTAAEEWQKHAEELRDRLAKQYESQIDYLQNELHSEQRQRIRRDKRREVEADEH